MSTSRTGTRPTATRGRPGRPRSLTDDLRGRDDTALAALLRARPDLVHPVPADLAALAARATTLTSVGRALDRLDVGVLQVLEALAALPGPARITQLRAGLPGVDRAYLDRTVARLRELALVWGRDDALHVVQTVRQLLGEHPGGLGPAMAETRRGVAPYATDPGLVARTLARAPAGATEALERMLWGPPVGHLADADRQVDSDTARTPVEWLLAHHLLEPESPTTVVLPREVALALRGGALVRDVRADPPEVAATAVHPGERVDQTAGQQAFWFVRHVAELLAAWSSAPPPVLRSGGLGVRELARTAAVLDLDQAQTAVVVEVAREAGLLAADDAVAPVWCPTPAYDTWLERPTAHQWAVLAQAWLDLPRVPALLSTQPRPNLLTPDLERPRAPQGRRFVLQALAGLAPGTVPEPDGLAALLAWLHPRLGSPLQSLVYSSTLAEAEQVGVTGLGAFATTGRALLAAAPDRSRRSGDLAADADLVAAVAPVLPALVDHVLLQADLTAVAPGPLEHELAAELALVADVESTGGAAVYRFSETSVRRALDAGRSATDVLELLRTRSRTPVPQPLEYLVTEAARRHGAVRVGVAATYVRCDDPVTVSALLADRATAMLHLVRLADTVVVTTSPPDIVLARLREAGFAPAAESADGAVVVRRPDEHRASPRLLHHRVDPEAIADPTLVDAAVRALRAGEHAAANRPAPAPAPEDGGGSGRLPRTSATESLAVLRDALAAGRAVWIGYVDNAGLITERVVEPLRLEGGFLTGYDLRTAQVRTFTISRITAASPVVDAS